MTDPSLDLCYMQTVQINEMAGNRANQGWDAARSQIALIESEFLELKEAVAKGDLVATRDGLADLQFTLVGLAHRTGISLANDWAEVVRSNLTKFDKDPEAAKATAQKYRDMGIEVTIEAVVYQGVTVFATKSLKDQVVNGKDYPMGKWLKSTHFDDVHFKPMGEKAPLQDDLDPIGWLITTLAGNYRFRHAFAAAFTHTVRQTASAIWPEGHGVDFLTLGRQSAVRFIHTLLLTDDDPVAMDLIAIPPFWSGTWEELAGALPLPAAALVPSFQNAFKRQLEGDQELLGGYHDNVAMAIADAWDEAVHEQALSHYDRQVLARGVIELVFGIDDEKVFLSRVSQSDHLAALDSQEG